MMTCVGVILGTAAYMAPEQAKGDGGGYCHGLRLTRERSGSLPSGVRRIPAYIGRKIPTLIHYGYRKFLR